MHLSSYSRRRSSVSIDMRINKYIIKQAIKKLLNYGIEPTNILYIPLENSLLSSLTIENIINVYQQYVCRAETSYYFIDEPFLSKTSDFNNISNLTNGSKVVVAQSFNNVKQVRKKEYI